ncbi:MAG: VWA domain-containing protein [Myxococcales bacterium]|nr:VWA domain-containing protein [Myxococcales bacterium]
MGRLAKTCSVRARLAWTVLAGGLLGQSAGRAQEPIRMEGLEPPPAAESAVPAPAHADQVVVLLDSSGSMSGLLDGEAKMTIAKRALKSVLARLPAETHVGMLTFANDWIVPLGPRDDAKMLLAINAIEPHGPTPLGGFLKRAADALLQARARQYGYGSYRLVVITDGVSTDGALLDEYAPDVLARGIVVDAIGVDMAKDHVLKRNAHSYRRANNSADLERAVAAVFAEVAADDHGGAAAAGGAATRGGDAAGAEVFAAIQPLDAGVADRALAALAGSGNHPIGTLPEDSLVASAAPPDAAVAAPAVVPPTAPAPAQPEPESTSWRWVLAAFVFGIWLLVKAAKALFR